MPTIRVPIKISVSVTGTNGENIDDALEKIIHSQIELTPMEVVVNSPHGTYVEFGTHPAKNTSSEKTKGHISPVRIKFREWARVRCADKAAAMGISTDRFGDMIYHKIMSEGMKEHPYMRPAIYEIMDDLEKYFKEGGGGTVAIANDLRDKAQMNLILNDNVYTGSLRESIEVRKLSEYRFDEPPSQLEKELWARNRNGQEAR